MLILVSVKYLDFIEALFCSSIEYFFEENFTIWKSDQAIVNKRGIS